MTTQNNKEDKGWQFLNIGIAAPECMMPFIQEVVQSTFEKELENTEGIYSSKVDIPIEDEPLDEFLCVEVYGLHGSFSTFYSELQEYKVDKTTFGKDWTHAIFQMLKVIADFIKANTNKPQAIKNKIISILKITEAAPILGLMSQITVLWGLVRMLECCGIDEDSPQYNDFITLHDWLVVEAGKRICDFTIKPVNMIFSNEDMQRVQPFCDYLYYGTDIGKLANEMALDSLKCGEYLADDEVCEIEANDSESPNIISSENVAKAGRPKGKNIVPFQNKLLGTTEEKARTLEILHTLIDGKKGKFVALVILGCMQAGKLDKPSFSQLKAEFNVTGNRRGYEKYMREDWHFSDTEKSDMAGKFL